VEKRRIMNMWFGKEKRTILHMCLVEKRIILNIWFVKENIYEHVTGGEENNNEHVLVKKREKNNASL
jgi:hypothetical protein